MSPAASRASARLAVLWVVCFVVALTTPVYFYFRDYIEWPNLSAAVDLLCAAYIPYLGTILGYYFVSNKVAKTRSSDPTAFRLAMVSSLLWNTLIIGFMLNALRSSGGIEESEKLVAMVSPKLAWFVAPTLGYFFGKTDSKPQS
jgi:hypothetical protein